MGTKWPINGKLKEIRDQKGLTQEAAAKLLGMDMSTYSRKETGKVAFRQTEINTLLSALELKYEDVFLP